MPGKRHILMNFQGKLRLWIYPRVPGEWLKPPQQTALRKLVVACKSAAALPRSEA